MDGMLSLTGNPCEIKLIILTVNGKDIEFKPASLTAFGINAEPLVNETPEDLYEWKSAGEVMGKKIETTRTRPGYVVLATGERIEGELQLRKTDGVFDLIKIKSDKGKGKYGLSEVNRYGITLTINELTDGGKKIRKDWALNFHAGFVLNESGEKKEGFIAFKNAAVPNSFKPLENVVYTGIYFTEKQEGMVSNLSTSDIVEVQKKSGDSTLKYEAMGDGAFMFQVNKSTANAKVAGRMFQKGSIHIAGGTTEQGEVAQIAIRGSQFIENIRFRYPNGAVRILSTEEVERFTQIIQEKEYTFIKEKNYFIQLEFEGKVFLLYRNPFPTSVNKAMTNLAKASVEVGGSIAASEMAKSGDRKAGWGESNIDSIINNMDRDELVAAQNDILSRYEGSEEKLQNSGNDALVRYYNAVKIKLASKDISANVKVMNKEWIILNKKTNETSIIIKEKYKTSVEPMLMSCEEYLIMDKKIQQSYKEFDNIIKVMEMLDKCYQ